MSLITISQALPSGEKSKCDVGKKPENTSKNRYKTTFPCKYISFYNHFKQFCFFLINGLNIFFKMIQKYVSYIYIVCFHIDLSVLFVFLDVYLYIVVFLDIYIDDHSRVILNITDKEPSDYINANYIDVSDRFLKLDLSVYLLLVYFIPLNVIQMPMLWGGGLIVLFRFFMMLRVENGKCKDC